MGGAGLHSAASPPGTRIPGANSLSFSASRTSKPNFLALFTAHLRRCLVALFTNLISSGRSGSIVTYVGLQDVAANSGASSPRSGSSDLICS